MKTLFEIVQLSANYLEQKAIKQAKRQAEDLLCDALNLTRLQLYMQMERPCAEEELKLCRERLIRKGKGEPLAYIHGSVEFYNCTLSVNPSVLIPRQETEILVDKIAEKLKTMDLKGKKLWDLCCGSGCIGIALKKKFPELDVTLADISSASLEVASENAKKNGVEVTSLQGDLFNPFTGKKTDFLVCNPPYISAKEFAGLEGEVKNHEPSLALLAGETGLEFYEKIAINLKEHLNPAGLAWFEIGWSQGPRVCSIFQKAGWYHFRFEQDWSGKDRFFFLENE
jgi:release factor glutamine methyltransferase